MEFDTFGGSKLELLCGSLGVDEFVKQVGLVPADADGEEVIDKAKGWNGDQVLVAVEVLVLHQALLPNGVDLQAGDERGKDIPLHDNLIKKFSS